MARSRLVFILAFVLGTVLGLSVLYGCSDGGEDDDDSGDDDDRTGITWVSIPGGTFRMGCVEGDPDCYFSENPGHEVTLDAFEMLSTEVVQAKYLDVMGKNASHFSGCPDCPVETVSWFDASEFCEEFGGRLPTEAEWEYAARAGTTTIYYCGDSADCLDDIAWYSGNSDEMTHSVGEKEPNAFGLYDMLGNVWEWCADWYDEEYYGSSPAENPTGPEDGTKRVLRGGGWKNPARLARASARNYYDPDSTWNFAGFRCARDAEDAASD